MKPLPSSKDFYAFFGGVRVYRDDLERILGLMRHAGLTTTISDNTFEYESLDEFQKTRGNSPREMKIAGINSQPFGTISLSLSGRRWNLSSYNEQTLGVAREIDEIIRARQSAVEHIRSSWMAPIGGSIALIGTSLTHISFRLSVAFVGIGAALLLCAVSLASYSYLRTGIVLKYRYETGFLSRNRDRIIVAVCTALFLAALQLLIRFLTGKDIQLFGP